MGVPDERSFHWFSHGWFRPRFDPEGRQYGLFSERGLIDERYQSRLKVNYGPNGPPVGTLIPVGVGDVMALAGRNGRLRLPGWTARGHAAGERLVHHGLCGERSPGGVFESWKRRHVLPANCRREFGVERL